MRVSYLSVVAAVVCCDVYCKCTTYEDAVVSAYNSNNEFLARQTDKEIASAVVTQANKLLFLPNVNASMSASRKRSNVAQTRSQESVKDIGKTTGTQVGLTITQNLFNGFSSLNSVKSAESSNEAASHKLKYEEQTLIIKVLDTYTNVWVCRQEVDALKKKEGNLKNALDYQKHNLEAGIGTSSDVAQADANYKKAVYERINAQTKLFSAEADFKKLIGKEPGKNLELPDLSFIAIPKSSNELIDQALAYNHSIQHFKYLEIAEGHSLDATRGALSPSCDLVLNGTRYLSKQSHANGLHDNSNANECSASLEVTIPIYSNNRSSGNTYSAIEIANEKYKQAKFNAANACQEVIMQCITKLNEYYSSKAARRASRSAIKSATLSSNGTLEELQLGTKSQSDVLTIENQLLQCRVDLANSIKQTVMSIITISALNGSLGLELIKRNIWHKNQQRRTKARSDGKKL